MRKLVVKGGTIEQEYPLIDTTIIGRASSSTIRLEGQKVADEHAKISKTGPNIFVEDLDTPHGITVNGKKVARWALKKGDLIGVGAITLLYDEDDKPDPPPKAKAPPIPETLKSAANLTPAKSGSAVKNPSKETLPTAVKNGVNGANGANGANGNGAHAKSAATLPAAKAKDSIKSLEPAKSTSGAKAVESKPAVPKPVEPKPAQPVGATSSSQVIPPAKNPPANSAAKSSSLIAAVVTKNPNAPGSGRSSANSSQSLNAVTTPSNYNSGNSSRINIASENKKSSPGMSAVGQNGPMVGSGNSKSGILSAAGGKFRPGLSGHLSVPGAGGGGDSSARMSAAGSAALIAQRMSSAQAHATAAEPASDSKLPAPKVLLIAVGVLCFLVLVLGGVLIATLSRGNGPTSDEKAAMMRLQAKGPKASDDLRLVTQRLRSAHQVSEVIDILGQPDLKFTGEVPLWDAQTGTTRYPGSAFIAYYISDEGAPSAIEESPTPNILLFMVSDPKVEFIGPKKYARLPTGPEKSAEAHGPASGEATPAANLSPTAIKSSVPVPLPPTSPTSPTSPALPPKLPGK